MKTGQIIADPRHTARRIRTAIQGNVIRALVELITNSDDSYIRLEEGGKFSLGTIEILYKKVGRDCIFAVRDNAEGMSYEEVEQNYTKYGAATSGLKSGKKVRGYFGQGAKDALAFFSEGQIITFKNGICVKCDIFMNNDEPSFRLYDPEEATEQIREEFGIQENGTIAFFKAENDKGVTVPQYLTVFSELGNNFLLRKIMTNKKRKVYLTDVNSKETKKIKYTQPVGEIIENDSFSIPYKTYDNFLVNLTIFRSNGELSQKESGFTREGGILITDDENSVLDLSLFKYDNEPLLSNIYGEACIHNFRILLENEEPVLREERDGLDNKNPFYQSLKSELEKRLESILNQERKKKEKEDQQKLDLEEANRFKKAFNLLNKIAQDEVQSAIKLTDADDLEYPKNGFCLYPATAEVTIGKKYRLELRYDTKMFKKKDIIKITCSTNKVSFSPNEINAQEEEKGIMRKYITIEGLESNVDAILSCACGEKNTRSKISIVPDNELYIDGLLFQPQSLTLHPNQPRKVSLLVYTKIIESGELITLTSSNENISVGTTQITVNEYDSQRHVCKYEIDVWGDGIGQQAEIWARTSIYETFMEVNIASKVVNPPPRSFGMFDPEPFFDSQNTDPNFRSSYSEASKKITIYTNFPTVKFYLGPEAKYRKTIIGQIYVAEIIAEKCFWEMSKRKIDNSGIMISTSPESFMEKVLLEANTLSKKYGAKLHESLVDQLLLKNFYKNFVSNTSASKL